MKTIKRLSLSEQVVRSIVQYVQENNLQPGDQLPTENEFAESFGVSRTSVREAIKALGINGMLKSVPGRGTFLQPQAATLHLEDNGLLQMEAKTSITELMEVRAPLEVKATELAVERCSEEDIQGLEEICKNYRAAVENNQDQAKWGKKFHRQIAEMSGNAMLNTVLQSLAHMTDTYRKNMADEDREVGYYVESHMIIIEAFKRRDVLAAAVEMDRHMQRTLIGLTEMVAEDNATKFIYKQPKKK